MKHTFDNGKYSVEFKPDCTIIAERHGEPWQDLTGNNLIYWMIVEIESLKEENAKLKESK